MAVAECLLLTLVERGILHPDEAESALEDARITLSSVAEEVEDPKV
jgi:hypothetical protein